MIYSGNIQNDNQGNKISHFLVADSSGSIEVIILFYETYIVYSMELK